MLENDNNTIAYERQQRLVESFEQINFLINNNRLDEASEQLMKLHYADLADFLDNTNHRLYSIILPKIADELNPDTLVSLSDGSKQPVLGALGFEQGAKIINKMDIEDAIEVVEVLDDEFKELLLQNIERSKRQQILEGFNYPENTVGRVLERDFVAFREHWTVGQAIDFVRRSNFQGDFHAAIIVNARYKPVGNILLSTLLKNSRHVLLRDLMNSDFNAVDVLTPVDELVFIFKQYALTIVPVVNKAGKLIGTVSIDSMIYIIEEQTESEFMHLGGVNTADIFGNLVGISTSRFPWLFVNLITACLTSVIVNEFSGTIAQLVTLASVMPIVAALGGNVGAQVMTVTVRAIANREINQANKNRVILREILVCLINGCIIATIGALLTYLLFRHGEISAIFAVAVLTNFVIAGLLGSGIPILMNALELDPAIGSGVIVTACTDAMAFLSFLGLACFFLF